MAREQLAHHGVGEEGGEDNRPGSNSLSTRTRVGEGRVKKLDRGATRLPLCMGEERVKRPGREATRLASRVGEERVKKLDRGATWSPLCVGEKRVSLRIY